MKLASLLEVLDEIAPLSLAESWDKAGLHAGDRQQNIHSALLCIDLTESMAQQAVTGRHDLVIAYHPPVFEPLKTLTPTHWKTRALLACVKKDIAIYSPHTALDAAQGGLNDWLASGVGEGQVRPIKPCPPVKQGKLVTFIPPTHADALRQALSDAGAGHIGQYDQCSFNLLGQGTFRGSPASHPVIGKAGQLERVEELRIEMLFPWHLRETIIEAVRAHHPYEEPAFDLYEPSPVVRLGEMAGQGRIVTLDKPVTLKTLTARLSRHLGGVYVEACPAAGRSRTIRTVGLCAGAGGSLLAAAGEVDAFFTGEMRYHDVLAANQEGMNILLAGHVQTERPFLKTYRAMLAKKTGKSVKWTVARE